MRNIISYLLITISLFSCKVLHQASEANLKTGYYQLSNADHKKSNVYVIQQQDSIRVYNLIHNGRHPVADSIHFKNYSFPQTVHSTQPSYIFTQKGVDMDIISIAFKLRPATGPLPPQLNTNFNAAVYVGYRWDNYRIDYKRTPLKAYEKSSHHFAYGAGAFAGLGATAMNEFVTDPAIDRQYDGLVFAKGITGIIGVGHFSFGLAVGSDNIIGAHSAQWLYNNKLWTGITIGLNLN